MKPNDYAGLTDRQLALVLAVELKSKHELSQNLDTVGLANNLLRFLQGLA